MQEKDFHKQLIDGFEWSGITAHKFPDLARGLVKPYDLVCNFLGEYWAIEAKVLRVERLPPNDRLKETDIIWRPAIMRPKQIINLAKEAGIGGQGLVALLLVNTRATRQKAAFLADISFLMEYPQKTLGSLRGWATRYQDVGTGPFVRELSWKPTIGWTCWGKSMRCETQAE